MKAVRVVEVDNEFYNELAQKLHPTERWMDSVVDGKRLQFGLKLWASPSQPLLFVPVGLKGEKNESDS